MAGIANTVLFTAFLFFSCFESENLINLQISALDLRHNHNIQYLKSHFRVTIVEIETKMSVFNRTDGKLQNISNLIVLIQIEEFYYYFKCIEANSNLHLRGNENNALTRTQANVFIFILKPRCTT